MRASATTCEDDKHHSPWRSLRGRPRLSAEYERAPNKPGDLARRIQPAVLPYRVPFELSHSFDARLRAGPFLRWHHGQDYDNIGFVHRRKVWMIGSMLELSGNDRITKLER
jgi:hypothetical protein